MPSLRLLHSNKPRVLSGHGAQLQGGRALGRVSGDGGVALEGWAVFHATITPYGPHRL